MSDPYVWLKKADKYVERRRRIAERKKLTELKRKLNKTY